MNLLEIRTEFVKRTGRRDLVVNTTAYVDNGCNVYINEAINFLDKKANNRFTTANVFKDISHGDFSVTIAKCRAVKNVWVRSSTVANKLMKITPEEFRDAYDIPIDPLSQSMPSYYTTGYLLPTSGDASSVGAFINLSALTTNDINNHITASVIFAPVADIDYSVEIEGLFATSILTRDNDYCHWSVNYPGLVILTTQYCLERAYRNFAGARDLLDGIMIELVDVEKDLVEQEITEVDEIEG